MEGGSFSACGARLSATHSSLQTIGRVSRIEGGRLSTCGNRLSAAIIRLKHVQEFRGMRAG
eukprot:4078712-Pyramimonas_sp.AAC.1